VWVLTACILSFQHTLCSIDISEEGQYVATGATDGSLTIWEVSSGAARHVLPHDDTVIKCAWLAPAVAPDAAPALKSLAAGKLAAACADGNVYVWDARDGKQLQSFSGHAGMVLDLHVRCAADGIRLFTGGDDGCVRMFIFGSP
jgi:WD40 repeat protein